MSKIEAGMTNVEIYEQDSDGLIVLGTVRGTIPTTASKFQKGCLLIHIGESKVYQNTGTSASPSWNNVGDIATGDIADAAVTYAKLANPLIPTRPTGDYAYLINLNDGGGSGSGAMTGGAAQKTYAFNVAVNRPLASAASGDSNDSVVKLSYNNYAANDSNFIIRGLNSGINNRDGGELGILEGGSIGSQNKSGGIAPTLRGLTVTPENYGTVATEFGGIDIVLKNEANAATLTYGMRIRNIDASAQAAIQAALLLSNTATHGFLYGIDMNGATVETADIRLSAGIDILSGAGAPTGVTASKGSLYLRTDGTTTNDRAYINTDGGTTWTALTTAA